MVWSDQSADGDFPPQSREGQTSQVGRGSRDEDSAERAQGQPERTASGKEGSAVFTGLERLGGAWETARRTGTGRRLNMECANNYRCYPAGVMAGQEKVPSGPKLLDETPLACHDSQERANCPIDKFGNWNSLGPGRKPIERYTLFQVLK